MANAGSFKKGVKKPNQGKRGPGKATLAAREAIARFVDGNVDRLNAWLDEIEEQDGPQAAFKCFSDLIEYHVPKLTRAEVNASVTVKSYAEELAELNAKRNANSGS